MVPITELWLAIVLSAVAVFVVSSVIHMVLTYHRNDFGRVPDEDVVLETLRGARVPPGSYFFPYCASQKEMASPEMKAKLEKGPVGFMTVLPNRAPMMPKHLLMWFVYCLVVGFFLAYLAGRTLAPGAHYLAVFRVVGVAGFLAYSGAHGADPIWKGERWSTTLKTLFDGLVYGLVTAGVFGWLWPA